MSFRLKTAGDDMLAIAKRLGRKETDLLVQDMQAEVLRNLKELEAAFNDELNRRRRDRQKQKGGGGGKQPLVPPSAELIMLRDMQNELNSKLRSFVSKSPRLEDLDEVQRAHLERLAHRQGLVKEIWTEFMEALGIR